MTLYRQIAILVSFVFLILLSTILLVSFSIVRESAKKELYENAQNSVSSLSISISSTEATQGAIETMINASFDNGNYERITFVDIDEKVKYERTKEINNSNIPAWFEEIVEFELPVAKAKLSSGWQVIGTLEILNNRSVTYFQLYNIMMSMVMYLGIACIVFLLILSYVFHVILRPLLDIEKQAQAVMKDEFVIQEKMPWTKEFKAVIESINAMVRKFESIFKTASDTLTENKELLYNDNVMKIANRRYFILKATEYLTDENGKNYGSTIIMSVKKADVLNQVLGYQSTDKLLFEFAQFLKEEVQNYSDAIVCRINGTEIVVMLPKIYMQDIKSILDKIVQYINDKLEELKLNKEEFGLDIGVCEYEPQHNMSELFSLVDYALAQAKLLPSGHYYELLNNKVAIAKERWRQIILDGFKNDSFEIMYRKVVDTFTKVKRHNVVSFALNSNNESYFYGTLIAPVVELGMVQDVYLYVIKKVLLSNDSQNDIPLTIQISSQFIEDEDTYEKLKKLFRTHQHEVKKEIIFEIPESVINKHFENSQHYIKLFKEFGFGFGINSFMAYGEDYNYLKELKPAFVKADKQYILDAQQNINVLKIVLDSLGIELIATGVNDLDEIESLNQKGIKVVAGMVVDKI
ncbi:LapD/MoxY N-terminal periplasmic domain-containing protein [Candidatus Marinarcus aquaticus]|uniref:Diguanylate cyclase n=1 Tax=Candidatus Marinarcus aquaticus TaxID=2044504 RepID=A0A4Q0XRH4_9BACT|nr:LapD/MoxY N-terminal periplasmic domain-containing protein [Candidatus Marinarcus aquaticus]RXJ54599.1 diguanylate cyclase [Candidatus Marinarcus aquaticus]